MSKFTVEQAYARYVTRTATYLGATDYEPVAPDLNIELGYLYRSSAILSEDGHNPVHTDPGTSRGRPGSRAPHLWLDRDGRRVSTLDLFGSSFVLLSGSEGAGWCDAAEAATKKFPGLRLDAYRVGTSGVRDPEGRFPKDYGVTASGAVLVRPDGFVAWRAESGTADPYGAIEQSLRAVLARD